MDTEHFEEGIAVISLAGKETFATKYSMEAFIVWYDKTYELNGCTREALEKECAKVLLDQDGVFVDAAELKMSVRDVEKYKETHENCECIDWNNRKIGQWIEEDGKMLIFMSYREIIKRRVELGENFDKPVMLMSVYG